jgi:hypothetical protein
MGMLGRCHALPHHWGGTRKGHSMAEKNMILYVATYPESSAASADFRALKAPGQDFQLDKSRSSAGMDGKVEVDQSVRAKSGEVR